MDAQNQPWFQSLHPTEGPRAGAPRHIHQFHNVLVFPGKKEMQHMPMGTCAKALQRKKDAVK